MKLQRQEQGQTYRCQLCGAEKFPGELYHDGRSFITCKDVEECLIRVGHQELAMQTAVKLKATSANQWERMKRNPKR